MVQEVVAAGVSFKVQVHAEGPPWAHNPEKVANRDLVEEPVCDATYVDDEAYAISADSNEELAEKIKIVAEAAQKCMERYSLVVNWAAGKTEVLAVWRGRRTKWFKRELKVATDDGEVQGIRLASGNVCRIVERYKHLGMETTITPTMAKEVQKRLDKARAAFYILLRKVFLQRQISVVLRLRLFQALVMSVALYGSEVWDDNPVHIKWVQTFYMKSLRRIAGRPHAPDEVGLERVSDERLLEELGQSSVAQLVFRRRLAYAASLVREPMLPLLGLLEPHTHEAAPWANTLLVDLRLMKEVVPRLKAMPDPYDEWQPWMKVMAGPVGRWKSCVKLAAEQKPARDAVELASRPLDFECVQCQRRFASQKALISHCIRKHNYRAPVARLMPPGTTCGCCGKCFSTRRALIDHAQHPNHARQRWLLCCAWSINARRVGKHFPQHSHVVPGGMKRKAGAL